MIQKQQSKNGRAFDVKKIQHCPRHSCEIDSIRNVIKQLKEELKAKLGKSANMSRQDLAGTFEQANKQLKVSSSQVSEVTQTTNKYPMKKQA